MAESRYRHELLDLEPGAFPDQEEGWLLSYLDVLTLLITLFVLLLALAGNGQAEQGSEAQADRAGPSSLLAGSGLLPANMGLQPALQDLNIDGVSVVEKPQGLTLRIEERLLFASGEAHLSSGGEQVLAGLAQVLTEIEGEVSVEGHSDNLPITSARFPSNWELSTARAAAVLRVLVGQGFARERLRAVGYADTRPLQDNSSASGRQANRRVELLVTTH